MNTHSVIGVSCGVGRQAKHTAWVAIFHQTELGCILFALLLAQPAFSQTNIPFGFHELLTREQPGQMYEKQGEVRFKPATGTETNASLPQPVGFDETLRTLAFSGAVMRLTDQT